MDAYDAQLIEEKWQRVWEDEQVFHVGDDVEGPRFYML
jgi:leucyl-tRNA synthetase